jgi:hypothetical protein
LGTHRLDAHTIDLVAACAIFDWASGLKCY